MIKDPKSLGIPNICFSLTEIDDIREPKFKKQRVRRGFDDSETWDLRSTIANFILPRLKRYYKLADKAIIIDDFMREKLKSSIIAFKLLAKDNYFNDKKKVRKIEKGLRDFSNIYEKLWW